MKDRLLEIMRLAYEINENIRWTFVDIDYTKGMGTVVHIHDALTGDIKTYCGVVHDRDVALRGGKYIEDTDLEQAYKALKEIMEGAKAA